MQLLVYKYKNSLILENSAAVFKRSRDWIFGVVFKRSRDWIFDVYKQQKV